MCEVKIRSITSAPVVRWRMDDGLGGMDKSPERMFCFFDHVSSGWLKHCEFIAAEHPIL